MPRSSYAVVMIMLSLGIAGCAGSAAPETALMLLPPGDEEAGKEAFVALRCYTCHAVEGHSDIPEPYGALAKNIFIEGHRWESDRELVAKILEPSHELTPELKKAAADQSDRTGRYGERIGPKSVVRDPGAATRFCFARPASGGDPRLGPRQIRWPG